MYNFLARNGQTLAFGIGALLTIIFYLSVFSGLEQFNMQGKEDQWTTNIFNIGFYASIVLTIACLVAAVAFGLMQMVDSPKAALKGVIGVVALLAIFFLIYSSVNPAAAPADVQAVEQQFEVTAQQSKFISGSIITTVVLAAVALVTFLLFEVINLFK
jgi:hypothetical protein